jgi:hypothetical protein
MIQAELESTMLVGSAPRLGITNDRELSRLRGAAAIVLQRHSGYLRSKPTAAKRARRAVNPS